MTDTVQPPPAPEGDLTARPPLTHHPLCNVRLSLVNPLRGCTCELADRLQALVQEQAQQIVKLQKEN